MHALESSVNLENVGSGEPAQWRREVNADVQHLKLIGLEEHCVTADVLEAWRRLDPQWQDLAQRPASADQNRKRKLESPLDGHSPVIER